MPTSAKKFDWYNTTLTPETVITDNYTTTDNVRQFFKDQIGRRFKFNSHFVTWIKYNSGNTLAHALQEWYNIHRIVK